MLPWASHLRLTDGAAVLEPFQRHSVRRASDLVGYAHDAQALQRLIEAGNPVIYETYEAAIPEAPGHLMYGITVLHPGRIGSEYYLTKGHYHVKRQTAEIYLGLRGRGMLVMQEEEGDFEAVPIEEGRVVYVPPGWAHRSVNTADEPLVMLYAFPADAGHDYRTIEEQGFRCIVVERDGEPAVVPLDGSPQSRAR